MYTSVERHGGDHGIDHGRDHSHFNSHFHACLNPPLKYLACYYLKDLCNILHMGEGRVGSASDDVAGVS